MKLEAERKARHDAEADQISLVQKAEEVAELTVKLEGERKARHDAEAVNTVNRMQRAPLPGKYDGSSGS